MDVFISIHVYAQLYFEFGSVNQRFISVNFVLPEIAFWGLRGK